MLYRKTAAGQNEIETRQRRLVPRLRSALIVIDGKHDDAELRKLIAGDVDETLRALVEQGLIEAVALAPKPVAKPAQPAAPTPPVVAPDFPVRRRDAVRALNDLLGPIGESVAIRMEKAINDAELRPLLERAVEMIATARGGSAAAQFASRYIGVDAG